MFANIISGLVIFVTHLLEGITGFGSTVLALPFLAPFIDIRFAVKLLAILGCSMAFYIVCRSWKNIVWKEFLFIALLLALGMPGGMICLEYLPKNILCIILGIFMTFVGIRGELTTLDYLKTDNENPVKRSIWMCLLLFCGGIIQGAFGSAGPFVVIYASRRLHDKTLFRVTLSLVWLTMNLIRIITWSVQDLCFNGRNILTAEMGHALLWTFPFMITGVIIGDILHHKVSQKMFKFGVYTILIISGILMIINSLRELN